MKRLLKYFEITLLEWPWFQSFNQTVEFKKIRNKK